MMPSRAGWPSRAEETILTITHTATRRSVLLAAPTVALATPALAATPRLKWRMATSWGQNAPGPGISAARIAETITSMSDGRLSVSVAPAGTIVPAFDVFNAVADGICEMGHSAAAFNAGKLRAAAIFTSAPFGLSPLEHDAWLMRGGGLALWRALYASFDVIPFAASNTGPSLGGWFTKPVQEVADFAGLKMRIAGLGGELFRRLGATPVSIPPGEIGVSLKSGLIDAAEFAGPSADRALGLYQAASTCYTPGFHEPNGTAEGLVGRTAWEALPPDLQSIVEIAFAAENGRSLADAQHDGALALKAMAEEEGVNFRPWPAEVIDAAAQLAPDVLATIAEDGDALSAQILASYREAQELA